MLERVVAVATADDFGIAVGGIVVAGEGIAVHIVRAYVEEVADSVVEAVELEDRIVEESEYRMVVFVSHLVSLD